MMPAAGHLHSGVRRRFGQTGLVLVLLAAVASGGCSPYVLRGKVVEGPRSAVMVVDSDDPELKRSGVSGAQVAVTIDPESLGRKVLPPVTTGADGSFAVPVDEFGAGALEYGASVLVRRGGYQHAAEYLALPAAGKRVLIMLEPGRDRYVAPEDPLGESQRFLPPMN